MAESTIITGQFVRISQTPASIGERLIALAIDYILLGFYVFSTLALFSRIHLPSDFTMLFFFAIACCGMQAMRHKHKINDKNILFFIALSG